MQSIEVQNISSSVETLKLYQDIAANMDDFLCNIAYMNNPEISSVQEKIMIRLKAEGIIFAERKM